MLITLVPKTGSAGPRRTPPPRGHIVHFWLFVTGKSAESEREEAKRASGCAVLQESDPVKPAPAPSPRPSDTPAPESRSPPESRQPATPADPGWQQPAA